MNNENFNRDIENYRQKMLNEYSRYKTQYYSNPQNNVDKNSEIQEVSTKISVMQEPTAQFVMSNIEPIKRTSLKDDENYKYFDAQYMQYTDMGYLNDSYFVDNNARPVMATSTEQSEAKAEPMLSLEEQYNLFKKQNLYNGGLRIQTFTTKGAFPVQNAIVTIAKPFDDGDYVIATLRTDNSGQTEVITLPAPDKNLSLSPGNIKPYATYKVTVEHPDFITVVSKAIPIFQGNVSLQILDLIPKVVDPSRKIIEIVSPEPFGASSQE